MLLRHWILKLKTFLKNSKVLYLHPRLLTASIPSLPALPFTMITRSWWNCSRTQRGFGVSLISIKIIIFRDYDLLIETLNSTLSEASNINNSTKEAIDMISKVEQCYYDLCLRPTSTSSNFLKINVTFNRICILKSTFSYNNT